MATASPIVQPATSVAPCSTARQQPWSLLVALTATRLKTWTRNRYLGFWWWLLEPLAMTATYIALVQFAFRAETPHIALFLMCAVLPWAWFTAATNDALMSLKRNRGRLLSFRVNATIFPFADVLATLVRYLASLGVFLALLLFYGIGPRPALVWLPLLIVVQGLLAAGFSLWLSVLQVYVEDTANIWRLTTRAWFFLGPSIYALSQVPTHVAWWLWWNPFTVIFHGYRAIWIRGEPPLVDHLLITGCLAGVVCGCGCIFVRRNQHRLALSL